jgi:hypothetical protein
VFGVIRLRQETFLGAKSPLEASWLSVLLLAWLKYEWTVLTFSDKLIFKLATGFLNLLPLLRMKLSLAIMHMLLSRKLEPTLDCEKMLPLLARLLKFSKWLISQLLLPRSLLVASKAIEGSVYWRCKLARLLLGFIAASVRLIELFRFVNFSGFCASCLLWSFASHRDEFH